MHGKSIHALIVSRGNSTASRLLYFDILLIVNILLTFLNSYNIKRNQERFLLIKRYMIFFLNCEDTYYVFIQNKESTIG